MKVLKPRYLQSLDLYPASILVMASTNKNPKILMDQTCANPCCFFCIMKEQDPSLRKSGLMKCFKEMHLRDDQEHVLVLCTLWNIAMTQPNDPEFPSLGIFECMSSLIYKGLNDRDWLFRDQNIYIPYYAAHVIGSYTMNKIEFAEKAVKSGVIPPLMELLRGNISWVEQRVAVRALGHLASYKTTFIDIVEYEEELIELSMTLASTCLDVVYVKFVAVKDKKKRVRYHCDLLTRGVGGLEMENRKAEEWASQLQCWSIYILNCFAWKQRSVKLICKLGFLKNLSEMWGGLFNHKSPLGIGLVRILCYSKEGRKSVANSKHVLEKICNLSRSSDDWQYIGIDCLLLLLKDLDTRFKVMEVVVLVLVDLVELETLGGRKKVGDTITSVLLMGYKQTKSRFKNNKVLEKAMEELLDLKVERRKRESEISQAELEERRVIAGLMKQEGNERFKEGDIEEAIVKYTKGLNLCPLKMRKERMILYSNRAQCHLLLRDHELAISDSTRALCLSKPANSHNKSLWRRSQAYDMKGLAKESLMDCVMFVNGFICSTSSSNKLNKEMINTRIKVPYYASHMINKQMSVTWIFAVSKAKFSIKLHESNGEEEIECYDDCDCQSYDLEDDEDDELMMIMKQTNNISMAGLSTIEEEEKDKLTVNVERRRKLRRSTRTKIRTLSSFRPETKNGQMVYIN